MSTLLASKSLNNNILGNDALEQTFINARTFNTFTQAQVSDELLAQLYELMKWGPTSMNSQPGHFVFLKTAEAKKRLNSTLLPGNQEKSLVAPVTVIIASDMEFFNHLPEQFPALPDAKGMFESNESFTKATAERNSSMQGAYLIIAARMLGLDCGPMSGFDNNAVDAEFFPEGRYKSNFLINLGYGDSTGNYPRGPRLTFEEAVHII
ncbi:malonic semialdehyde reductase [Moritella sp. Urea-trap-13]|uniref:malonic semialdehyde reductase n=1 Tax=Moritella sp. Urea-trap-13 TaxID=2058327 RepID=UPI000C32691A|nr:malonic semialdehyde reductase [Moritella sp. Urea-trap-13]PKH06631.1 malonic semialdehyde reductase [Moritella sp. Urea-trap-13]